MDEFNPFRPVVNDKLFKDNLQMLALQPKDQSHGIYHDLKSKLVERRT